MGKSKKATRNAKAETHQHHENEAAGENAAPVSQTLAEPTVTARKAKKTSAPKAAREERNGIRRPSPGKCLEVWDFLDQCGDVEAKDLKLIAIERGWNANNAVIELYRWRKFNGITRAATK